MAVDKLVDSTQLDSDLTSVANAIRIKGGTSAQLAFPSGFVSAIGDIPSGGGSVQTTSGTFIGDDTDTVKFPCSFEPDAVYIKRINITTLSSRVFAGFIGMKCGTYVGHSLFQNNANTSDSSCFSGALYILDFTYTNGQVVVTSLSSRPVSSLCEYAYYAVKWT